MLGQRVSLSLYSKRVIEKNLANYRGITIVNITLLQDIFIMSKKQNKQNGVNQIIYVISPCRVGSVGSVSASRTVGREFASRPGHIKDHHKNDTNCLPA